MSSLVSVIIPSYNHCRYIADAIDSVLGQSHEKLELIVVDDGSTDESLAVIRGYHSEKIKLIVQENQGAHAAINLGIAASKGEFVTVLNSDDIYHPKRLTRLVEYALSNNQPFVFSGLKMIDDIGEEYRGSRWKSYVTLRMESERHASYNYFLLGNIAYTTSNFFMRRSFFDRVGGFKQLRYTHDWNWALRSTVFEKNGWLKEDLLYYRVHGSNTLNETDLWASIVEDSYNFSCYLYSMDTDGTELETVQDQYIRLLAKNRSYHPFFVSLYLSFLNTGAVEDEDDLLAHLNNSSFIDDMKKEVALLSYDPLVFHSLNTVDEFVCAYHRQNRMIKERDQSIRANEKMIDERDQSIRANEKMIDERNTYIQQLETERQELLEMLHSTVSYKTRKIISRLIRANR